VTASVLADVSALSVFVQFRLVQYSNSNVKLWETKLSQAAWPCRRQECRRPPQGPASRPEDLFEMIASETLSHVAQHERNDCTFEGEVRRTIVAEDVSPHPRAAHTTMIGTR
jgi:hypothetical protein